MLRSEPYGWVGRSPHWLIALGLSRNAALSGAAFFVAAGAVGWWASSSVLPAVFVTLAAGSVVVKSCIQYGWLSSADRARE